MKWSGHWAVRLGASLFVITAAADGAFAQSGSTGRDAPTSTVVPREAPSTAPSESTDATETASGPDSAVEFDVQVRSFQERKSFTDALTKRREEQQQREATAAFDAAVERYARRHQRARQLVEHQTKREQAAFAEAIALEARKRAFTQRLVAERTP